jgi:hypothetical protein
LKSSRQVWAETGNVIEGPCDLGLGSGRHWERRAGMTLPTNSMKAFTVADPGARAADLRVAAMPMMMTITPCQPGPGRTRAT